MVYVRNKHEKPKEPAAGGDVSDSEVEKPIGKSGSASSALAQQSTAGGDSAQLVPVTSSIVQSKRIGSGGM
eukprot:6916530-Karenia_brevis.AAC.1